MANGADSELRDLVESKLRMVGLAGISNLRPSEISGGMKKRVALARAIALDPDIILYDEPTTGLDPIMAEQINELIRALQKKVNATSIVVTRSPRLAPTRHPAPGFHDMSNRYRPK